MKRSIGLLILAISSGASYADGSGVMGPQNFDKEAFVKALKPSPAARTRGIDVSAGLSGGDERRQAKAPSQALDINFGLGSAILKPGSKRFLEQVAALLRDDLKEYQFDVEGHTDVTGNAKRNIELSERRAKSVVAYLSMQYGIGKERLHAVGKGASEPKNTDNPAAAENRRVEFVNRGEVTQ